jgi:WD40 repeat protein
MNATPPAEMAPLYEQPVLVIDPGMHTGVIKTADVDKAGRIAVTGPWDKTVRVWSVADGKLLQTICMPAGPGNIGKIYAVAMSPDGNLVAAGGWTAWTEDTPGQLIYLFETRTGKMVKRISGLPEVTQSLAFSLDGRYLAAGLGVNGLRVFDRDREWAEALRDTNYGGQVYGVAFAADGRLATTSYDGMVRLYDRNFKPVVAPRKAPGGNRPFRIAFSPDGAKLAVGYADVPFVDLFDGHSLAPLSRPNLDGVGNGNLMQVMWSRDRKTLYAGGLYHDGHGRPVLAWANAGRGARRRALPAGTDTVGGLAALPDCGLLVAAQDPFVAVLDPDGRPRWVRASPQADLRDQYDVFAVSADGALVDFGFEQWGKSPLRFDLHALKLTPDPPADGQTIRASQAGFAIEGWRHELSPTLDGQPIVLEPYERSRSLAVHPDGKRFVLGADWFLRALNAKGQPLWQRVTPGVVWGVNITGDGRLVVAAYGDGTICWHRMDDGRELLALYVLQNKQDWVAWTPEGFYGATPGAFGVLQWQVNHGFDAVADTVPVNAIPRLRRPDALKFVVQEMETARALGIADLKAARREVQIATGSAKAPGARLHVLTIGVSDYGDKASDLRLKFAHRDAQDVASALVNTQEGGLYVEVLPAFLHDGTADKAGIFDALAAMQHNMAATGQDLAVVMFSGHGTMIDGQFYLLPHGVDNSTPARLKASAIPATEFQGEILKLAAHGRVLVLLDACRSAGLIGGAQGADMLRSVLAANNVTVLTSSKADKLSREDEKWGHGAFTKVLLDALSADDIDTDRNGVISMTDLSNYMEKNLDRLTDGDQQLGLNLRFQSDIFVAGL